MLLNDIGKSPDATFRRINQHLETNYGFKISEDVSDKDLDAIMEQIEDEITGLKVKGDDARGSSEISKRLLVLEGIRTLREHGIFHMGVPERSPDEESVVNAMIDRVVKEFKLSGNFADSIRDTMNRYRSSEYRFLPDDEIEQRVYTGALSKLRADPVLSNPSETMMEEEGPWTGVGKRSGAGGGHHASPPDTPQGRNVAKALDNPSLELEPPPERDPWKAHAKKRKEQGIVHTVEGKKMREHKNLVKNLRRLLETEVSQAEVMMAAKGFAQELQEMVEKIGRLQNEDLPPVTDQMRETYGMESASAFQTQIYGALQGVMDSLYTAKQQVDDAVDNMASTGQVTAQTDMDVPMDGMDAGASGDMAADDGMGDENDLDNIGADLGAEGEEGDEFGGEEALGRSKKMESVLQKKVMEMKKLVAKAKKLKESRN